MESRERAALLQPRGLIAATLPDLPGAVHPADVLRYRDAQYRRPGFPYARFDEAATYWWKSAHDVFADRPCFMLADWSTSRVHCRIWFGQTPTPAAILPASPATYQRTRPWKARCWN